ncbi:MAG: Nif3-like dinuclear metal center hexameric protein [Flavobacterium sp.]|nr:Nif3-like dinuclear metal center hexameric protein [Pedobacter sp.]
MLIKELATFLESIAPLCYQEDYDNSGLLVGSPEIEITSALISLDCTEEVVDEAISRGCNLVISHHPIVFKGLKNLTGSNNVERVVIKAIKHEIALYAIHTNFDNVLNGVNSKICEIIGLKNCNILHSKRNLLKKLVTYVPLSHAEHLRTELFNAGAGNIGNYSECSFNVDGNGTYLAGENASPYLGNKGLRHVEKETRIEVILPDYKEQQVLAALHQAHPYEEVAFDLYSLANNFSEVGSGMIGNLEHEMSETDFLNHIKLIFKCAVIKHTSLLNKKIKRVAVCGGSGGFLLQKAITAGADIFITSDLKYHEFFEAEKKIIIADIGHFESEQFTQELLQESISKKFPKFALHLTKQNTNPIKYLI